MSITMFGRVELDPNRVPVAAPMTQEGDSFRRVLDAQRERSPAESRTEPRTTEAEVSETVEVPPTEAETPVENEAPEPRDPEHVETGAARPAELPTRAEHDGATTQPKLLRLAQGGRDPGAAINAGKGPGSLPSLNLMEAAAEAATLNGGGVLTSAVSGVVANPSVGNGQTGEAKVAIEQAQQLKAAPRASAAKAGYRVWTPQMLQLAESARDSVFRQIAMRMNGEGGEMRVLLDPPELGELDLHMVVEKGGALRLSIVAERPELALVLDKHMAELRQSLELGGLEVTHAEVHTQGERADNPHDSDLSFDGHASGGEAEDGNPRSGPVLGSGYITADGLDFWV